MREQTLKIQPATKQDIPLILAFIKELAEFEQLSDQVVATEQILEAHLFSEHPHAEVIIAYLDHKPVGFALFFHNFSTFLGQPGIYLEDLFVKPEARSHGIGKKMLSYLAALAKERKCGRLEWSVLNWNKKAIQFYKSIGANPMDDWTVYRVSGTTLESM